MKIDKEKLAELSGKSDSELWQVINEIAAKHGYDLPKTHPKNPKWTKFARLWEARIK